MTFGIAGLLSVGYLWMLEVGINEERWSSRATACAYGSGAALTLDEFALWLNLDPNTYWTRQGRVSIDAVILFGGLLAVSMWGAPFFRGLHHMWTKRGIFGRGLVSPIRRVRLLRPRKSRRQAKHNAP